MFYVIELQTTNGQGASIITAYPNKQDALASAYAIASVAVKSAVELHTVMVVNGQGFNAIDPMIFEHKAVTE